MPGKRKDKIMKAKNDQDTQQADPESKAEVVAEVALDSQKTHPELKIEPKAKTEVVNVNKDKITAKDAIEQTIIDEPVNHTALVNIQQ